MKTQNVHIWYDAQGRILAVGRAPAGSRSAGRVIPQLLEGQQHLEDQVPEEAVAKLHETHCVDVGSRVLKPVRAANRSAD